MLAEDGTVEVTAGGVTRMSRPPPNPGRLFAVGRRRQQRDPDRRQRELDAITGALALCNAPPSGPTNATMTSKT